MNTNDLFQQFPDPKPAPEEEPAPATPEIDPPIQPDTPVPNIVA